MKNDQELQNWLASLREETPTDLEMARWKQAVRAQAAKTAPAKPRRSWMWKIPLELTKVAALLVAGFLAGDYYTKVEAEGQFFSQVTASGPVARDTTISALSESYPLFSAKNVRVVDGRGKTWLANLDMDSEFVGVTTHQGTIVFSTFPFRGAEAVGEVAGTQARLKFSSGLEIRMTAAEPLLAEGGNATVYAVHLAQNKSAAPGVVQVFEAATEDRVLSRIAPAAAPVLSQ